MNRMFAKSSVKLVIILMICSPAQIGLLTRAQVKTEAARKFDEFGDILYSDLIAHLDNFAIQLQNEPDKRGFIVVYRTRRDLPGLSNRYALRMKSYLKARGVAAERVVTVDGGVASCLTQELWMVPVGATPTPRSDAFDNSFVDTSSALKFDEHYFPLPQDSSEGGWFSDIESLNTNLDAYATALQKDTQSRAYIIAYAQYYIEQWVTTDAQGKERAHRRVRQDPSGTARKMLTAEKNHLVKTYHLAPSRIKLINGGYRTLRQAELWIVPRGASAPIPTPNQFSGRHQRRLRRLKQ